MFKIKSKITIKLLHQYPDMSILTLLEVCYALGENYLKYINEISPYFFLMEAQNTQWQNDMVARIY